MPPPMGFVFEILCRDFDPGPVDAASAAVRDYSLTVDAASDIAEKASLNFHAIGTALTSPAAASIAVWKDFEAEMYGVQKITGDTDAATRSLGEGLVALSRDTLLSANQLANVAGTAASLGIRGAANLESFTGTVARMALVTDLSANEAAKSLARISLVYSLTTDQVERLGSAINELENRTTATAQELVSITQRLGPLASTIGLTAQQAIGLAATLRDVGVTTEEAGTGLSTALQKMGGNLDKFANAARINGKVFREQFVESPFQALLMFLDGIHGLAAKSTPEALEALKSLGLGGARSSKVFLSLANSIEKLKTNIDVSNQAFEAGTSLQNEFDTQMRGLNARLEILVNRIKAIGIAIGNVLGPPLSFAVGLFSSLVYIVGLIPAPILAAVAVTAAFAGGLSLLSAFGFKAIEMLEVAKYALSTYGAGIAFATGSIFAQREAILSWIVVNGRWAASLAKYVVWSTYTRIATALETGETLKAARALGEWIALKGLELALRVRDLYTRAKEIVLTQLEHYAYYVRNGLLGSYIKYRLIGFAMDVKAFAITVKNTIAAHWHAAALGVEAAAQRNLNQALVNGILEANGASAATALNAAENLAAAGATEARAGASLFLANAQNILMEGLGGLSAGFNSLTTAMLANPVTALAIGVIALTVGYGYLIKKILDGSRVAQAFGLAVAGIFLMIPGLQFVSLFFAGLVAYANNFLGMKDAFLFVAYTLGYAFGRAWGIVKEIFKPLIDEIEELGRASQEVFRSIGFGGAEFQKSFDFMANLVEGVFQPFKQALGELVEDVRDLFVDLGLLGPTDGLKTLFGFFKFVLEPVVLGVTHVISFFFWSITKGVQAAVLMLHAMLNPFWAIKRVAENVKAFLIGSSLLHIGESGIQASNMMRGSLLKTFEDLGDIAKSVKPEITPIVTMPAYGHVTAFEATRTAMTAARVATSTSSSDAPVSRPATGSDSAGSEAGSSRGGGGRKVEITLPVSLLLDGRVLAQVVKKFEIEESVLGFGPLRFTPGGD